MEIPACEISPSQILFSNQPITPAIAHSENCTVARLKAATVDDLATRSMASLHPDATPRSTTRTLPRWTPVQLFAWCAPGNTQRLTYDLRTCATHTARCCLHQAIECSDALAI